MKTSFRSDHVIFEHSPAEHFCEAFPIGNGHIGGMVYMDPRSMRIGLNHDEIWAGTSTSAHRNFTPEAFLRARELALEGRYKEASQILSPAYSVYDSAAYLPLGDITVEMPEGKVSDYVRSLSLDTALAEGSMVIGDISVAAKAFASYPANALIYSLELSSPCDLRIRLTSPLSHSIEAKDSMIRLVGSCPSRAKRHIDRHSAPPETELERTVRFAAVLGCRSDGNVSLLEDSILLSGAQSLTLAFSAATSYLDGDPQGKEGYEDEATCAVSRALAGDTELLFKEHLSDHSKYYDLVDLHLEGPDLSSVPTSARIAAFGADRSDSSLITLAFNLGRYLMIAGSRKGSRALNLQGIWNDLMDPPWNSNYTTNINTEMNYWPAAPCGLHEMTEPLFDLVSVVARHGRDTAKHMFGARGTAAGHNADIFGFAAPSSGQLRWSFFPLSLGWLLHELYDRYLYTKDKAYLERLYPLIEDVALFCIDTLVPDGDYLIFAPGTSAENAHSDGIQIAKTTTFFMEIIRDSLGRYVDASSELGRESEDVKRAREIIPRLLPTRITSDGRIEEWYLGEGAPLPVEPEPLHRHISHLYGLYPANTINTDELRAAAARSLDGRGDVSTGWSLGWKMCARARLGDADAVDRLIGYFFRPVAVNSSVNMTNGGGVYSNLFCAHPPFQIDGNFAFTRALLEMLSDTKGSPESYLRGIPARYACGYVKGMFLEGGRRLDLVFRDGKVISSKIYETENNKQ